jgi:hypothetical protein
MLVLKHLVLCNAQLHSALHCAVTRSMAEETIGASRSQPRAIILGWATMCSAGLALLLALLFAMPVRR